MYSLYRSEHITAEKSPCAPLRKFRKRLERARPLQTIRSPHTGLRSPQRVCFVPAGARCRDRRLASRQKDPIFGLLHKRVSDRPPGPVTLSGARGRSGAEATAAVSSGRFYFPSKRARISKTEERRGNVRAVLNRPGSLSQEIFVSESANTRTDCNQRSDRGVLERDWPPAPVPATPSPGSLPALLPRPAWVRATGLRRLDMNPRGEESFAAAGSVCVSLGRAGRFRVTPVSSPSLSPVVRGPSPLARPQPEGQSAGCPQGQIRRCCELPQPR